MVQHLSAIGILIAYFICYGTVRISSSVSWRLPLAFQSFLAFLFAALGIPLPQSPRWLTLCARHEGKCLLRIRLDTKHDRICAEGSHELVIEKHKGRESKMDGQSNESPTVGMQQTTESHTEVSTAVIAHSVFPVFRKDVRSRKIVAVYYYLGMQSLCGIDSILYYAPFVVQKAGFTSQESSFLVYGVTLIMMMAFAVPAKSERSQTSLLLMKKENNGRCPFIQEPAMSTMLSPSLFNLK